MALPAGALASAPSASAPSAAAEEVRKEVLRESVGDLRRADERKERREAPLASEKGKGWRAGHGPSIAQPSDRENRRLDLPPPWPLALAEGPRRGLDPRKVQALAANCSLSSLC